MERLFVLLFYWMLRCGIEIRSVQLSIVMSDHMDYERLCLLYIIIVPVELPWYLPFSLLGGERVELRRSTVRRIEVFTFSMQQDCRVQHDVTLTWTYVNTYV